MANIVISVNIPENKLREVVDSISGEELPDQQWDAVKSNKMFNEAVAAMLLGGFDEMLDDVDFVLDTFTPVLLDTPVIEDNAEG